MRVVNDAPPGENNLYQGGERHVHVRTMRGIRIHRDVREIREAGKMNTQRIELRERKIAEETAVISLRHAVSLA